MVRRKRKRYRNRQVTLPDIVLSLIGMVVLWYFLSLLLTTMELPEIWVNLISIGTPGLTELFGYILPYIEQQTKKWRRK